jgi:hypothetical protein
MEEHHVVQVARSTPREGAAVRPSADMFRSRCVVAKSKEQP